MTVRPYPYAREDWIWQQTPLGVLDSFSKQYGEDVRPLTPSASVCSPFQVLLSPDMDFDQSESDQDISGLRGTNQKMKQPSYQVVI